MKRVIIDTNIMVSALLQRSYPYLIINQIFSKHDLLVCISNDLFDEYVNVLQRSKFSQYPDFEANAQALLLDIKAYSKSYTPHSNLNLISDQDDNKLLELAEVSNADFLITGNHNDFTMDYYKNTQIITPKEFWEMVMNNSTD